MFKRIFSKIGILMLVITATAFIFMPTLDAALETQLLVDVSPSVDNVPYLQTQWYGFNATANKGYCAILTPSTGNSDSYLFDTNFNLVGSSKNTATTQDKVWYGQASSGPMHIASYGAYNPSSNFTIQVITAPYVKSVTPISGTPGTLVTLNGFGFGDVRGTNYVKFGTVQATSYYSWINTQIKVYLPSGIANGAIQAVVYVAGRASNPANFTGNNVSSDGTMWRCDLARTGNYPNGPTALPLNLKWTFTVGGYPLAPTIANNIVYLVSSGKLYALDANAGILKWSSTPTNTVDFFTYSPAVAAGKVYIGTTGGIFYALDANNGALKWSYNTVPDPSSIGDIVSSPAVSNGIVYFTGGNASNTKLFALDATNGTLKWSCTVADTTGGSAGSPAIANDIVYFVTGQRVYAVNASTGTVKWTYSQYGQSFMSSPAIANGILYVSTMDYQFGGRVLALDANTGSLKWQYHSGAWYLTPAVANGTVYVPSNYGLDALDANTGAYKWNSYAYANAGAAPSVSNGLVYTGSAGTLSALDTNNGTIKWSYAIDRAIDDANNSPVVYNGKLYISAGNGKLYCFGQ